MALHLPFRSLLAPTDETEAILYTYCVKHSRMTNYSALTNFRAFNIDGVKGVLMLLWDIIKIELESFLERTNPYGSYQEETTDRCKLSNIRLSFNKQEA
eukprot:scaffold6823_cov45-Attheya_sp.AAC.1